jgi:hypothetical protein
MEAETTDAKTVLERLNEAFTDAPTPQYRTEGVDLLRMGRDALAASEAENAELKQSFDLYYAAEMRGIKMWQEATGKDMIWPDGGKLTAWLLERLAASEARMEALDSIIEAAKHRGSHSLEVALLVNAAVAKRLDEEYKAALVAAGGSR